MEEKQLAICAKQITKVYKLYDKSSDRLKEALGLSRKKLHKEHYALKGVDLSIYKGETVGIIGTNGSGKSTILKLICGLQSPTSGKVAVPGGLKIGYLPQIMEHHRGRSVIDEAMTAFADMKIDLIQQGEASISYGKIVNRYHILFSAQQNAEFI